ncbi:MAG: glycosyltransferase N-terminal domain-containing protein [bacterium]
MYNIFIYLYSVLVRFVGLFNHKAALLWCGQREAIEKLEQFVTQKVKGNEKSKIVWVHAASLGEFEQGRPLIERIRNQSPDAKIILTFFSPSGYEVRKNYQGADLVLYLPFDTKRNARRFLDILSPDVVYFVKYEFWVNYLTELRSRGVETYIISAIFRPNQIFFKWYGGKFRKALKAFKTLFVQNEESEKLLNSIGFENVVVAGDTRFDRVADIASAAKQLPIAEAFAKGHKVLVVGSSWSPDEEILADYINRNVGKIKIIIATHDVNETRIKELTALLKCSYALYTQTDKEQVKTADCLIINTIGLLSSIYQYGQVAYIGGGFGVAVHNTLEAAVWGMPVVFGPKYHKFQEACELIECGAACSINSAEECYTALDEFFRNNSEPATKAYNYVASRTGATSLIINTVTNNK